MICDTELYTQNKTDWTWLRERIKEEVNLLLTLSVLCFLVFLPAVWFCLYTSVLTRLTITSQVAATTRLSASVSCIMIRVAGFSGLFLLAPERSQFLIPLDLHASMPLGKKRWHLVASLRSVSGVYMTTGMQNKLNSRQAEILLDVTQEGELSLSVIIQFHGLPRFTKGERQ